MHAISVKELREKFTVVRSELKKGESFLIIYKSKPIAELKPVSDIPQHEEATDDEVELAAIADAEQQLGDDFLSEEEVDYYLSLPEK